MELTLPQVPQEVHLHRPLRPAKARLREAGQDEDRGCSNGRIDNGMGNDRRQDTTEEERRGMREKDQETCCIAPTWRRSDSSMH
ncbi:hypothetical protein JOQ06_021088 [Pogonophryne albipinna]|uniref:Uncharacterized protein n=1 Tax=Pogonophryne albipinna TaxID=1090488 RepID=A0AAD6FWR5_9TELE|nr:hypothetical protein JOQ06_021088 [Pogonophryne albipinna]